jgi:hypothetical protein
LWHGWRQISGRRRAATVGRALRELGDQLRQFLRGHPEHLHEAGFPRLLRDVTEEVRDRRADRLGRRAQLEQERADRLRDLLHQRLGRAQNISPTG